MFAVLVVLPTPPLPLVTTMTRESPAGAPPASSPRSAVAETRRAAPPDNKPAKSVPSQRGRRYRSREYRSTRSQQVAASRRAGGRSAGESALTGALLGYAGAEAKLPPLLQTREANTMQCQQVHRAFTVSRV